MSPTISAKRESQSLPVVLLILPIVASFPSQRLQRGPPTELVLLRLHLLTS